MEAADLIRQRAAARSEYYANLSAEHEESKKVQFGEKVRQIADAIVATNYVGCSIYEWAGEEHVGIELYSAHTIGESGGIEGFRLHLLIDAQNQYQVIIDDLPPEDQPRVKYNGETNILQGHPFDPRSNTTPERYLYGSIDYNLSRMDELLAEFEKIKTGQHDDNNHAWYRA